MFSPLVVGVDFQQESYAVSESESIRVCVELSGVMEPTEAEIWVNISSFNYSADGNTTIRSHNDQFVLVATNDPILLLQLI